MASILLLVRAFVALLAAAAVLVPLVGLVLDRRREARLLERDVPADPGRLPPASVVVPVKGRHQGLEDNVRAYLVQDHPDREVLFVVDALDDPAVPVLEAALEEDGTGSDRLVSVAEDGGDVGGLCTGKQRAQATGISNLRDASEVVAFGDADVRPRRDWLRRMTAPIADEAVQDPPSLEAEVDYEERPPGAVTSYRWYVSERHGFWSRVRAQWNATGHDAFADPAWRFCWGGSMAIRRELLDRLDVLERMQTVVADDVAVTEAVHQAGYRVVYEPEATGLCVEDVDEAACHEWCVRQTAITRATMPGLWKRSVGLYVAGVGSFVLGVVLVGLSPIARDPVVGLAGLGLMAPVLTEPLRSRRRWELFRSVVGEQGEAMDAEPDLPLLALGQPFYMLWVLYRSARVSKITWRGRTYPLEPSTGVGEDR